MVETVLFLPYVFSSHGLLYMSCSSLKHGESVFRETWDETGQSVKFELSRRVLHISSCHSGRFHMSSK